MKGEELAGQMFAVYGAGAGGIGVTRQICTALVEEGLTEEEARERIFLLDSRGVIYAGRDGVDDYKMPFARNPNFAKGWSRKSHPVVSLEDLVNNVGITVLLGFSGSPGAFTEELVGKMTEHTSRPVIFPLSNPTSKAAAKRLAELVSEERLDLMCVYPAIADLRYVCKQVAIKVAAKAIEKGVASAPVVPESLEEAVCTKM
ncbi:MAG: hypothetical protein P1S46_05980 [bacterium]|nr:hypothetical protein [bacterium]